MKDEEGGRGKEEGREEEREGKGWEVERVDGRGRGIYGRGKR